MLSRVGDFYYDTMSEDGKLMANKLSHISMQCRVLRQLCNAESMVLANCYYQDNFKLIPFKDSDVCWYGLKDAIQKQHVTIDAGNGLIGNSKKKELTIDGVTFLNINEDETLADKYIAIAAKNKETSFVFPEDTPYIFGLSIDPDIMVTSIRMQDGTYLYANVDYLTEFGYMIFYKNPLTMFGEMRIFAVSYTYRHKNLYSYPLSVDVYGPVDKILKYYKVTQSPNALYHASAQAIGMPVVRNDCKILSVAPLHDGVTYFTTDGRYDADYPHTHLEEGTTLKKDQVIAGDQLYRLLAPNDLLPSGMSYISLDYAIPVKGLRAENKTIRITDDEGNFRPQFTGSEEALQAYWDYIAKMEELQPDKKITNAPAQANGLQFFRTVLCANRCIIAQVNTAQMTNDMQLKLISFLRRELPLGSVLTTAELPVIISEENSADV